MGTRLRRTTPHSTRGGQSGADDFAFEAQERRLAFQVLKASRAAGAIYADARVGQNRSLSVTTREQQISGLFDNDTMGIGVRVIAGGAWGATSDLTSDGVATAARQAVVQARANAVATGHELSDVLHERSPSWSST